MAKSIDEEIIKDAVKKFIHSNPELIRKWVEEAAAAKKEDAPLFPKFDKEKIMREHAIKWEDIEALQELFKDAPPAEEMVKLLSA